MQLDDLLSTALVGTAQAVPPPPADDPATPLHALLIQLPMHDSAHTLLATAGTLALRQEAVIERHRLATTSPNAEHRTPNTEYQTPDQALTLLIQLCLSSKLALLTPLLQGFAQRGWHVPLPHLPHLLQLGQKHNSLKPLIPPVLDEGGRWLAQQNPAWRYALWAFQEESALFESWAQADLHRRVALLTWARHHDPALGLRLLRSRWRQDSDSMRQRGLPLLLDGLSSQDESFLERALDDRQVTVRRKAQELLAHLPQSSYAQRMRGYADQILRWRPRQTPTLVVRMPATFSPAMIRDGLLPTKGKQTPFFIGSRLTAVIAATPLDHWTEKAEGEIVDFLALVGQSNWQRTITAGLIKAIRRQKRADWADQLVRWARGGEREKQSLGVAATLTPQAFVELLGWTLQETNPSDLLQQGKPLQKVITAWKRPFPPSTIPLLTSAIASYLQALPTDKPPVASFRTLLRHVALYCPAEQSATLAALLESDGAEMHPRTHVTLNQVGAELAQRQKIAKVLGKL